MDYLESFGVKAGQTQCHEELVYRIVILYSLLYDKTSTCLKKFKLTPAKMNVLMIVKHQGGETGISQVELSRRLMVTTSNLTRVLAKLQREGLIERGNIKEDLRFKTIQVTPKASKLLDKVWPGYTRSLVELTSGLPEEKKQDLCVTLSQWMDALKEKNA
jgi:DNA-binding MarR family transcriptional regulator